MSALLAGIAKLDITPDEPLFMGGYSLRGGRSRTVHGKLFVRALALSDGRRTFIAVVADLINVSAELRFAIGKALGVDPAWIYVGDTHNHAGPLSSPVPKQYAKFGNDRTRWFREFPKTVLRAARQAVAELQPVKLGFGTGRSRIAMNRRKRMSDSRSVLTFDENHVSQSFGKAKTSKKTLIREHAGVIRLGTNPRGPIDDEVGVVRLDTLDGRPLAALINYACHGTSLGGRNDTICGEWMGRMLAVVEQELGAEAMFFQGAAGDINPRVVGGLDGHKDDLRATEQLGEEIAREVVRVHGGIQTAPEEISLRAASASIQLPRCYRELFADFKNTTIDVPTTVMRMGDVTWVNFPGEMFHETGLRVKKSAPTPLTFIAGYTSGSALGYMPTAEAFAEGGYEPAVSHLDPVAEQLYLEQLARLMARLR